MPTKNKIPLTLTAQQRNLLLKYIHQIVDEEIRSNFGPQWIPPPRQKIKIKGVEQKKSGTHKSHLTCMLRHRAVALPLPPSHTMRAGRVYVPLQPRASVRELVRIGA